MPAGKVIVMQGVSGAGKSTYARKHYPGATIVSADNYFVGEDGVYRFNREQLNNAHAECRRLFDEALERGDEIVVVDNTNLRVQFVKYYIDGAAEAGYSVNIVSLVAFVPNAFRRSVHGLSFSAVDGQARLLKSFIEEMPHCWSIIKLHPDGK